MRYFWGIRPRPGGSASRSAMLILVLHFGRSTINATRAARTTSRMPITYIVAPNENREIRLLVEKTRAIIWSAQLAKGKTRSEIRIAEETRWSPRFSPIWRGCPTRDLRFIRDWNSDRGGSFEAWRSFVVARECNTARFTSETLTSEMQHSLPGIM